MADAAFNGSKREHPLTKAGPLVQLYWLWLWPLLLYGRKHDIKADDIWELPKKDHGKRLLTSFNAWRAKHPEQKLSVWRLLAVKFWKRWAVAAALYVVWCTSAGLQPYLVRRIVAFLEDETKPLREGVGLSLGLGLCTIVYALAINHKFHQLFRNGVRMRGMLMTVMFQKALTIAMSSDQNVGSVTNMMSNDTERLFEMQILFHYLWASPLFVVVMLILLALEIGPAAVVGFGLLLLVMPVQARLGGYVGRRKAEMLAATDDRTNLMSQVITGMNVIKLYSWELPFAKRLVRLRDREVQLLSKIQYVRALMRVVLFIAPSVVGAVTLAVYVALGNDLTLETTFSTLSYINIVRFPMLLIPNAYALLGEGRASIRRLEAFLSQRDAPFHAHSSGDGHGDCGSGADGGDMWKARDGTNGSGNNGTNEHAAKAPLGATDKHNGVNGVTTERPVKQGRRDSISGVGDGGGRWCVHADGRIVLHSEAFRWRPKTHDTRVVMDGANSKQDVPTAIVHRSLVIPQGSLVTVVGRVGSGKTAFLLSLLEELWRQKELHETDAHSKRVSGGGGGPPKICYAQQSHVIFNLTLKENVLFGAEYDRARFEYAVKAACLDRDIAILSHGAETEIGENGVNLSGGQKARVAFARCIYHASNAAAVLLDDPLSSVDIHVASDMFHNGIQGALRGKTRLVVMSSHQDLAREADVVINIEDGRVSDVQYKQESSTSITTTSNDSDNDSDSDSDSDRAVGDGSKGSMADVVACDATAGVALNSSRTEDGDAAAAEYALSQGDASDGSTWNTACASTSNSRSGGACEDGQQTGKEEHKAGGAEGKAVAAGEGLTVLEEKQRGAVSWAVYKAYAAAASVATRTYNPAQLSSQDRDAMGGYEWLARPQEWGGLVVAGVLLVYVGGQGVRVMADVWLTWWATDADPDSNDLPRGLRNNSTRFWIVSLFIWVASNVVVAVLRSLFCTYLAMRGSRAIHFHALLRLLHAPMVYFHSNPPGRLLNRFSTDLHRVDMLLPDFLFQFLDNVFVLLTAIVLAMVSVPWLLILLVPLLAATYYIQNTYRSTSRELLRIEAITKSPIYSLFSQVLSSRVSVRAFHVAQHLTTKVHRTIDHHLKIFLVNKLLERWMSITFNGLATAVGTILCLVAVHVRGDVDASLIGLALVYCLQLMGLTSWTVKMFIEVENNMTSLERIREVEKLELEVPRGHIDGDGDAWDGGDQGNHTASAMKGLTPVPSNWPREGGVVFKDVVLRYRRHLAPALKGFNLHIRPGEKLGICGRTGAGKSTIISALFRLFPCEEGSRIELDGVNLFDLPLHVARRSLAIIPQDPVLMNGTVRQNLDPLNTHDGARIWKALGDVDLASYLKSRFGDGVLDMEVGESDGAVVFSHGQRQLLCIARALLRESKVLVCDEATSSVDKETDLMIQRVLTQVFSDRTVVIIAHRLDTILTCDRVLVMDTGEAVEVGDPSELLRRPTSRFRQMVQQLQEDAVSEMLAKTTNGGTNAEGVGIGDTSGNGHGDAFAADGSGNADGNHNGDGGGGAEESGGGRVSTPAPSSSAQPSQPSTSSSSRAARVSVSIV